MRNQSLSLMLLALGVITAQCQTDSTVRINEIQVIGSHNSYHAGLAPSERKWLGQKNPKASL